jgi:serine/threonine protein kinase
MSKFANHNNILRAFGCMDSSIFMEFCSGGDLANQLEHFNHLSRDALGGHGGVGRGMVPEIFALHVFISLTRALDYLHGSSGGSAVLHRDIKPENILLRFPSKSASSHGMPDIVLADLGCATYSSDCHGVACTPGWEAPETAKLYKGGHRARGLRQTTKSDIYSLGLVMYHVCTFSFWRMGDDPHRLGIPAVYGCRGLENAIAWCLEPRQEDRPSAGELMRTMECLRWYRDQLFERRGALGGGAWKSGAGSRVGERRNSRAAAAGEARLARDVKRYKDNHVRGGYVPPQFAYPLYPYPY